MKYEDFPNSPKLPPKVNRSITRLKTIVISFRPILSWISKFSA